MLLNTCINYQAANPPRFGKHLAWGDTGTVISANAEADSRSNFESGPVAIAAALTGRVPRYGYHLGTRFYLMTARELVQAHGWRTIVTDPAKLANIIPGYDYNPVSRPTDVCVEAATTEKILR